LTADYELFLSGVGKRALMDAYGTASHSIASKFSIRYGVPEYVSKSEADTLEHKPIVNIFINWLLENVE
jgi:hypothetical protein